MVIDKTFGDIFLTITKHIIQLFYENKGKICLVQFCSNTVHRSLCIVQFDVNICFLTGANISYQQSRELLAENGNLLIYHVELATLFFL